MVGLVPCWYTCVYVLIFLMFEQDNILKHSYATQLRHMPVLKHSYVTQLRHEFEDRLRFVVDPAQDDARS